MNGVTRATKRVSAASLKISRPQELFFTGTFLISLSPPLSPPEPTKLDSKEIGQGLIVAETKLSPGKTTQKRFNSMHFRACFVSGDTSH